MKVFVVLANSMGGVQFVRVHRVPPDVGTGASVLEVNVVGVQPDPTVVYIAQTYDRAMDVHNFEGVYGDYDSARIASGPRGQALTVKI
ncbi:hypothetical protein [Burkholderia ubonensis]|uniref:hypothetical protein n=1 Tax=Burkholderia ubonensis TaxID=101571 RepID=UPI0012F962FC|nr:hypothetical protein [Burkholderia ubonensis]